MEPEDAPNSGFTGADNKPRWVAGNDINSFIPDAIVLKNQNIGKGWNVAFTLEKPFSKGLCAKLAYSYGEAKTRLILVR